MSEPNIVDLAEVQADLAAYKALDKQIKMLTEKQLEHRMSIEAAMGNNDVGKIDGFTVVTWKRNKKTSRFDKAAFEKAHPDIAEEFTELREGNRVFKVVG